VIVKTITYSKNPFFIDYKKVTQKTRGGQRHGPLGFFIFGLMFILSFSQMGCTRKSGDANFPVDRNLNLGLSSDIPGFNFLVESSGDQAAVLGYVYESLLDKDPDTYENQPSLAKSWEISKDGKSFTFELDEKAQWFDGKPVTSADVAFTLKTIFDPKVNCEPERATYGSLDPNIQIHSDRKFTIRVKDKHFKNFDLAGGFWIMPKHILEGQDMNKGLLLMGTYGSGPYQLEEWKKGEKVTLKKNPNYWGSHTPANKGAYNFDKIVFRIIREPKIEIEMLKQGYYTVYGFDPEKWERDSKNEKIQKYYETYEFTNKAPKGYSYFAWNLKNPLFTSVKVRKALSLLLNRPFMIEKFTFGKSLPALGPISSRSDYAPKDVTPFGYEPEKAIRLLSEEGWVDSNKDGVIDREGKKFEFDLLFSNPDMEKFLTVYKEDLSKAGIVCNLKKVDWNTFTKLLDDRKFDSVTLAWSSQVDPDLYQIWHSKSIAGNGSNFVSYSNPKVDKLIEQARQEFDREKRIQLNQQLSKLIIEDYPYTFFLESARTYVAARRGVKRPKDYFNYTIGTAYWIPELAR
jgi:microcin C transport system substrate-binding protein